MALQWKRWLGIGLGIVVGIVVLLVGTVMVVSRARVGATYAVTPENIFVPTDSAALERGRHLVTAVSMCIDCHGEGLRGQVMDMGPVGALTASNLTTGQGSRRPQSDADFVRAIRHGARADGSPLLLMPSLAYSALSAADLGAVIAYVRSVPPVDNELPATRLGPIGRVILTLSPEGFMAARVVNHTAPLPPDVPPGPTVEYGKYLGDIGGCTACHYPDLKGGRKDGPPGTPPSADLTSTGRLATWTEAQFREALRTGTRPDGSIINPFMPWRFTARWTDEEVGAVWAFLKTK